jgi:hypothetical protein
VKQALTEHLWDKFVRSERQVFGLYRINLRKRFPTLGLYFKFGFPVFQNEELRFRGVPDLSGNDVDIQAMDMDAVPSNITFSIASSKIYCYLLYVLS